MYCPGPPAALPLGERPRGSVVDSCGHLVIIVRDVGPQELADCLAVNRLVPMRPCRSRDTGHPAEWCGTDLNQRGGSYREKSMPGMKHQVLASLFRDSPALGLHLFQAATETALPPGMRARLHAAQFTDVQPPEYSADAAYLIEDEAGTVRDAAIAEVQLSRDEDKHASWLQYTATMHRQLRIPVTVMVLVITKEMERWCARPHGYDRAGNTFRPLVIGPSKIPWITDLEQARAQLELAVLSAFAHAEEPGADAIARSAFLASRDSPRATWYADAILTCLTESAQRTLMEYLKMHHPEYQSEFARKYVEEGRKEGHKEGQQEVLLKQLGLKFGELPDWAVQRLRAADDTDLDRWTERVLDAASLDDVFAG